MNTAQVTLVRKDRVVPWTGERINGRTHIWHDTHHQTWCGRKLPGLTIRAKGEADVATCVDCRAAFENGKPRPYHKR